MIKQLPKCGKCGATGVKIYREYGRREETDRCNECIDQSHKGWFHAVWMKAETHGATLASQIKTARNFTHYPKSPIRFRTGMKLAAGQTVLNRT